MIVEEIGLDMVQEDISRRIVLNVIKKRALIPQNESNLLRLRFPNIYAEIDFENNPGVDLENLKCGSHEMINWKCPDAKCDHHRYPMLIYSRTSINDPKKCPYCSNRKVCECQSFATLFPNLLEEIDWDLMTENPKTIAPGSPRKLPWKCPKKTCGHHKWWAKLSSRTGKKHKGCPYCRGTKTCPCDSFATLSPHLLVEIDWELMTEDPFTIPPSSRKMLPWKCSEPTCQHKWFAVIADRTKGSGCSQCNNSNMEIRCARHLTSIGESFIPQHKFEDCRHIRALSFDYFLDRRNIAIELDGLQHFRMTSFFSSIAKPEEFALIQHRDAVKNDYCRAKGIHLLRIAWSKRNNIPTHIDEFLRLVATSSERVERFIGVEYTAT